MDFMWCGGRWLATFHRPGSGAPDLFMECVGFSSQFLFEFHPLLFFLCAGACEVLGVFGAPLSGQFVR